MRLASLRALLGVLAALASLACGTRVTHERTVVEQRQVRLAGRWLPGQDRTAVRLRVDDRGVIFRVFRDRQCRALVQDVWVVEDRVVREPRQGGAITGVALFGSGFGLLLLGETETNPNAKSELVVGGVVFMLAGTIVLLAQSGQASPSTERYRQAVGGPPHEVLDTCPAELNTLGAVELVLPDGTVQRATFSPTGLGRFPISEAVWQKFGGRLDVDVVVDGVVVQRAVLERNTH